MYTDFLEQKRHLEGNHGFKPIFMPDFLKDYQASLVDWSLYKGRGANFADCGLGKSVMLFTWAENVARHTGGNVLILAPFMVVFALQIEAKKFGFDATVSRDGRASRITLTNYEHIDKFNASDFDGCVCDESSILKNMNGAYKTQITKFMRKMKYRNLLSATPSPNDFNELGTSSEALGYMGGMDMLNKFFRNTGNDSKTGVSRGQVVKWELKSHAQEHFWKWVTSWARAVRKPSDLGFSDEGLILPPLIENEIVIDYEFVPDGQMFAKLARGLAEERIERRKTLTMRCEKVAELMQKNEGSGIAWCQMNDEGDELERLIKGSVQVSGSDSEGEKEYKFNAFLSGEAKTLITKPKIGAWGLNFQHCNYMTTFPSHSFEQYYQSVRRCWRFGQNKPVTVDIVTTKSELGVLANLQRKNLQATNMFQIMVENMSKGVAFNKIDKNTKTIQLPSFLGA